jgi:hypothetical protein
MFLVQAIFGLGVFILHSGFAAILGLMLRWKSRANSGGFAFLIWLHLGLLLLPASLFVLSYPDLGIVSRLAILVGSTFVGWSAWAQPDLLPKALFQTKALYRIFGVAMAFVASWGICLTLVDPTFSHGLVGISAALACVVISLSSPNSLQEI